MGESHEPSVHVARVDAVKPTAHENAHVVSEAWPAHTAWPARMLVVEKVVRDITTT